MPPEIVLETAAVSKRFGRHTALRNVSLTLTAGEVFGLLGPNGAGKTTLIRILLGLSMPDSGRVDVFGMDLFRARRRIMRQVGAVVEAPVFHEFLSAEEAVTWLVRLSANIPRERIREAIAAVGLGRVAHQRVSTFSYGMKQRLGIAQALLPATQLLVLDEPTNGLDPHGIAGMRRLIRTLSRDQGITVLVSSHLLAEVEQICDRVAILHYGDVVLQRNVDDLRRETGFFEIDVRGDADTLAALQDAPDVSVHAKPDPDTVRLRYPVDARPMPEIIRDLVRRGVDILQARERRERLEDIFIRLTEGSEDDVHIDAF